MKATGISRANRAADRKEGIVAEFRFYRFDSPEYAADFQTLLRNLGGQEVLDAFWAEVLAPYGADAVAVDWGAGAGAQTTRLLQRFRTVYAVEPSPSLREVLARACPAARILPATIADARLPEPADVSLLRHLFYHIPDHKWGAYTLRVAAQLSSRGVLLVTLKHPDTACNAMLEAFGAPRFNLFTLDDTFRRHPEYRVERVILPEPVVTHSFEDTYAIARFMLSDRDPDAFGRRFTEEELRDYVRRHLWNDQAGTGGWPMDAVTYLVRRSRHWK